MQGFSQIRDIVTYLFTCLKQGSSRSLNLAIEWSARQRNLTKSNVKSGYTLDHDDGTGGLSFNVKRGGTFTAYPPCRFLAGTSGFDHRYEVSAVGAPIRWSLAEHGH